MNFADCVDTNKGAIYLIICRKTFTSTVFGGREPITTKHEDSLYYPKKTVRSLFVPIKDTIPTPFCGEEWNNFECNKWHLILSDHCTSNTERYVSNLSRNSIRSLRHSGSRLFRWWMFVLRSSWWAHEEIIFGKNFSRRPLTGRRSFSSIKTYLCRNKPWIAFSLDLFWRFDE